MLKGIKIRLYPNTLQEEILDKHLGNCRYLFNSCLNLKKKTYEESKITLEFKQINQYIIKLRNEYDWLDNVNSKIYQGIVWDLETAYKNYFKGLKDGSIQKKKDAYIKNKKQKGLEVNLKHLNEIGFPKFKKKHDVQSMALPVDGISKNYLRDGKLFLNKQINNLSFSTSKKYEEILENYKPKDATISKTKTGKYFVSFLFDLPFIERNRIGNSEIGIDLGVKTFIVTSDQEIIEQPKWIRKNEKKLKSLHKKLSKKQKGSKNKEKSRKRLAKFHEKLTNQRNYFFHKIINKLCSENQTIYLEDLNVAGMLKNHKLAKAISEKNFGYFKQLLKEKSKYYNTKIVEINRFYPSSKVCSNCGNKKEDLTLKDREYHCNNCGLEIDRDYNASLNILKEGRNIYKSTVETMESLLEVA